MHGYARHVLAIRIHQTIACRGERRYAKEHSLALDERGTFTDFQNGDDRDAVGQIADQHRAAAAGARGGDGGGTNFQIVRRFGDRLVFEQLKCFERKSPAACIALRTHARFFQRDFAADAVGKYLLAMHVAQRDGVGGEAGKRILPDFTRLGIEKLAGQDQVACVAQRGFQLRVLGVVALIAEDDVERDRFGMYSG